MHRAKHGVKGTSLLAFPGEMGEDEIQDALDAYKRKVASAGGKARAKSMTPEERKASATKASKAAAKARSKKAAERRKSKKS